MTKPQRGELVQSSATSRPVAPESSVALPEGFRDRAVAFVDSAREDLPSMVEDIRTGRETEVVQLNRQIVDRGARPGVPTPTHETVAALIGTFDRKVYQRRDARRG